MTTWIASVATSLATEGELAKTDGENVDCRAVARKDGHEDGGCGLLHCGSPACAGMQRRMGG